VRLEDIRQVRRVGYYRFEKGRWVPVHNVRELIEAIDTAPLEEPESISDVQRLFEVDSRGFREMQG
jgi:hypothetical protein